MSDQGESYLALGCDQCAVWIKDKRVRPALTITERVGCKWWTCPVCEGSYAQVASEVPQEAVAAVREAVGEKAPRYAEWLNLAKHGQWSSGVPDWARNHQGQMNDGIAMRAVIEELAALATPEKLEGEPVARMHPDDGRVIPESTYATGARDGGASWSSVRPYTIKLYAAPQARSSVPLTVYLDEEMSGLLRQTIGDDGDPSSICLEIGDGHSGWGLYVSLAEYPEEGAIQLAPLAADSMEAK